MHVHALFALNPVELRQMSRKAARHGEMLMEDSDGERRASNYN